MASLTDGNLRFLIDECLSHKLAEIVKTEFGCYAVHVPWLGKPPHGHSAWKDPDIVSKALGEDFVFVINYRRDFVVKYYPVGGAVVHSGLIIILEKSILDSEIALFRSVLNYIDSMNRIENTLI